MFEWLTQWITRPMQRAFELGKLAGASEARTAALREHFPPLVVEADKATSEQPREGSHANN